MASRRKKGREEDEEQRPTRSRGRRVDPDDADEEVDVAAAPDAAGKDGDEDDEELGEEPGFELRSPSRDAEVDQRQVESVTDRIFGSVLSRYGWHLDEKGHLEHLGEEERPRRHR